MFKSVKLLLSLKNRLLILVVVVITSFAFIHISNVYNASALTLNNERSSSGQRSANDGVSSPKSENSPPEQKSETTSLKTPSCESQGSCLGTDNGVNLNSKSSSSVNTGNVVEKNEKVTNNEGNTVVNNPKNTNNQENDVNNGNIVSSNPKVTTNPNTAVITNPNANVNKNNVDVNEEDGNNNNNNENEDDNNDEVHNYYYTTEPATTEQTNNYYYQQITNSGTTSQDNAPAESTSGTSQGNTGANSGGTAPVVVYNNSLIKPVVSSINLIGGNAGANSITGIDQGQAGQTLVLVGTSDEKYILVENNANVTLAGNVITLGQNDSLTLSFIDSTGKWKESSYTDTNK